MNNEGWCFRAGGQTSLRQVDPCLFYASENIIKIYENLLDKALFKRYIEAMTAGNHDKRFGRFFSEKFGRIPVNRKTGMPRSWINVPKEARQFLPQEYRMEMYLSDGRLVLVFDADNRGTSQP